MFQPPSAHTLMTRHRDLRAAIVFSGGLVYAAYEIGVIQALFSGKSPATNYQPLQADIFTGTSCGSINAAMMASEPGVDSLVTANHLEDIWLNRMGADYAQCREGAIRIRGDLTKYVNVECLATNPLKPLRWFAEDALFFARKGISGAIDFVNSQQPLSRRALELIEPGLLIAKESFETTIRETINLEEIRLSPRRMRIAATNLKTGTLKTFRNEEMTDDKGHLAIMASCTFPGLPPIVIGGDYYVDGGYVMNTPLHAAWEAGADIMHVIYMDPEMNKIPLHELENVVDIIDNLYHIMMSSILERDIELYSDINRGLKVIGPTAHAVPLSEAEIRSILRLTGRVENTSNFPAPYRKITIHRYHPHDDVGGVVGVADFDRKQIKRLIERGFQDAARHDCKASGCIFPD
jgi:predicted acylesterase/phospholipase RssA